MFTRLSFALAALLTVYICRAEVKLPSFFSDHMVLQQKVKIPIWGSAAPGEKISVSLGSDHAQTAADATGKWRVDLSPLNASDAPRQLEVAGRNKVTISDVLIGEVWICSGQSNMERQLGPRAGQPLIQDWEKEQDAANYPLIRHFKAAQVRAAAPAANLPGQWAVCSPATVSDFTAVGYFFARDLYAALKVPIGLIHVSVGGTPIEAWTSPGVQAADPEFRLALTRFEKSVSDFPARLEQYQKDEPALLKKHEADVAKAQAAGKPAPGLPSPPRDPRLGTPPASLYNGMIAPLIPYAMRGVIWYQGESNNGNASTYRRLFPAMIANWRQAWGEGNFPFLFVQVAPFPATGPFIREAQLQTLTSSPNTAMAVTSDIGFVDNIHPPYKRPVGERLALAARALAYGEKIEYSGPLLDTIKISGGQAVLSFRHSAGLAAKGGELKGFEIAGDDRQFVTAKATIAGGTVIVSSPQVTKPAFVRYGWANVPDINLFNQAGLPASPFRTDAGLHTTTPDDSHSKMFPPWYQECTNRVAAIKGKPCDVIFIGDSITQMWTGPGKPVWDKYYANRHALNFGVPGDTTGNVLWRFDHMDVQGLRPKVAILLIGTNNTDDSSPEIAAGVKAVLERTRALYPGIKIILLSILPNARATDKMAEANEFIKTFGDNQSVFYLDLASKMPRVGDNWKGLGPDHLHPDASGYEIMASAIEPTLKQLLGH